MTQSLSSLALLGQSSDPDSRVDAYTACLAELQLEQRRYDADDVNAATRLARKDLRSFESSELQRDMHDLALRFLSFVFSTDDLIVHLPDQMVLAVLKDLIYVFAKAERKSCALAAVIISLEIVSGKRATLIRRAALSLVPALADCIAIRFPAVSMVVKEVITALARLCKVVPDTMHVLRCSWAPYVLPIALQFADAEVQAQAVSCLEVVRPSSCFIGKELYKVTLSHLDDAQLGRLRQSACDVQRSAPVPAIWAVCVRCLGIYVFGNLQLWNQLASIWTTCFSRGQQADMAIACLDSWSSVIDAATTSPAKLHDLRLMALIARPFTFIFGGKRSGRIPVSVRMKAIDIWSKFLHAAKYHRMKGEIFQQVLCPVMQRMLMSGESAIMIAACNLLGGFFSVARDTLTLASQPSFMLPNSQLCYDVGTDSDRTRYFNDIFPHFIPLFKTLLNLSPSAPTTEFEISAIRNSWRFFLSNLSQLDLAVVQTVINELLLYDFDASLDPICFQYIGCIYSVLPPSVWFGDDRTAVLESPTGRLCERYLTAFDRHEGLNSTEFRLCDEWSKYTMSLSSACRQHHVEQRLVLLSTSLLEPIFRNVKRVTRHNVFALVSLARATCAAICQDAPVQYNIRYFHAICMDLLHNILTSSDLDTNALVNSCYRQQVQRFVLFLFRSVAANETFPADPSLLREYDAALTAALRSCSTTLRVYTCKFLDQAFGITFSDHNNCSKQLREAISSAAGVEYDSSVRSATADQEAYDAWYALYETFESATEKLLSAPTIRSDLRSRILGKIMEQRVYFDGLLSISSELCYTKPSR